MIKIIRFLLIVCGLIGMLIAVYNFSPDLFLFIVSLFALLLGSGLNKEY